MPSADEKQYLNWPQLELAAAYSSDQHRETCWHGGHQLLKLWSVDPNNPEQLYRFLCGARAIARLGEEPHIKALVLDELGLDDVSVACLCCALGNAWEWFVQLMLPSVPFGGASRTACRHTASEPQLKDWQQVLRGLHNTLAGMREESLAEQAAEQQRQAFIREVIGPPGSLSPNSILNTLRGAHGFAARVQGTCESIGTVDSELASTLVAYGYQCLVVDYLQYLPPLAFALLEAGEEGP